MSERFEITDEERANGLTGAWTCEKCGTRCERYRGEGDVDCPNRGCGAIYNSFGQRLRDDVHTRVNPSEYDEDISDLEGYEMMHTRGER